MNRPGRQSGQALVWTLVIMVLVFAMAGALALAASSLLDRQSTHRTAIDSDLRASDSITAAVAQVAGRGKDAPACGSATLPSTLPGGFRSTANCLRIDEVASSTLGVVALPWGSLCTSSPVTGRSKVWLFFSALASSGMTIWVDNNNNPALCNSAASAAGKCAFSGTATIIQKAIECDLSELQTPVLHVQNYLSSPAAVRFVSIDGGNANSNGTGNSGGSQGNSASAVGLIYELAATTGLSAGPQFEQGTVFVSESGSTTILLSEGAL